MELVDVLVDEHDPSTTTYYPDVVVSDDVPIVTIYPEVSKPHHSSWSKPPKKIKAVKKAKRKMKIPSSRRNSDPNCKLWCSDCQVYIKGSKAKHSKSVHKNTSSNFLRVKSSGIYQEVSVEETIEVSEDVTVYV